jgi:DNA-binding NarL/FixJ family response regulator
LSDKRYVLVVGNLQLPMVLMTSKENKTIKVLIADDSELVRDKIKELFSELTNVSVIAEAENAQAAIRLGIDYKPDVVIMDVKLSGREDGFALLKEMKVIHPSVVTIMLSNNSEVFYKRKLTELGADYFFDKSNEFEDMLKVFSWI